MTLFRKKRNRDKMPSLRKKLFYSLGSLAVILLVSGLITILEYRRMSDYVSELIAANIHSINLSQKLSEMTQEYNRQMLAVVVQNDISMMPEINHEAFRAQADSLRITFTSQAGLPMLDSVVTSFDAFVKTSLNFDAVFQADSLDTGEWFFGSLQPKYNDLIHDLGALNEIIYGELRNNSRNFDDGFYRSIMPGVVSVSAGILLIFLLFYFTMSNYVNPIYKMSDGIDQYRLAGRRYSGTFDGDDQLANINNGLAELIEENVELKKRIKALKDER